MLRTNLSAEKLLKQNLKLLEKIDQLELEIVMLKASLEDLRQVVDQRKDPW